MRWTGKGGGGRRRACSSSAACSMAGMYSRLDTSSADAPTHTSESTASSIASCPSGTLCSSCRVVKAVSI